MDNNDENKPPKWSLLRQNNETGEIVDMHRPFKNGFDIMVERKQRESDHLRRAVGYIGVHSSDDRLYSATVLRI